MKTTLDSHDELLARAEQYAKATGRPLHAVVEDGLRRVLEPSSRRRKYTLSDLRAGNPEAPDPLDRYSWPELRGMIYRDPGTR